VQESDGLTEGRIDLDTNEYTGTSIGVKKASAAIVKLP
jgi:hypothetical protein